MSERENFLTRWARRKREAEREQPAASDAKPAAPPLEDEFAEAIRARETARADDGARDQDERDKGEGDPAKLPSIDLSKLPPIESITATTDIRPFLAAGVPEELKYAALRRAWVVDPTIREFVGIAENQWDFTAPDGVPGFGPLLPVDDVRRLVAQVIGGQAEAATQAEPQVAASSSQPLVGIEESASQPVTEDSAATPPETASSDEAALDALAALSGSEDELIVQDDNIDAALRNIEADEEQNRPAGRRTHGSALPK